MTYTTINEIIANILEHPLLKDVSIEGILNQAIRFMRIVGSSATFVKQIKELEVKDYRTSLPCDLYELLGVRDGDNTLTPNNSTFNDCNYDHYKQQGSVLMLPFKEGKVTISYNAIQTDENGFPMIPDNEKYKRALELFIKKYYFTMLFDEGKISQAVLQNTQQEYSWAVGQATNNLKLPTPAEMENLSRMWNRLLVNTDEFANGFKHLSSKEQIKVQL